MDNKKIIIIGGGLVGSLLGLILAKRGIKISVYESRPDMRKSNISAGKSINLALSHRGLAALEKVGLKDSILQHAVKMKSRIIHSVHGDKIILPYGTREGEYINSISRKKLNEILMNELELIQPNCIRFNTRLVETDNKSKSFTFDIGNGEKLIEKNCRIFVTDGAFSATREYLLSQSSALKFNYSQSFQNYGYKELNLEPDEFGQFQLENNGLHIWPRGHFMMIALPNPDASFTCTLFAPYKGKDGFEQLISKSNVENYFTEHFPDITPKFNDLADQFFENPIGNLVTVKCHPWHIHDETLLLGDAAHAIIPFYGQGMNCGFEDVFVLDKLMDEKSSWIDIFECFTEARKINSDAIADLAEDNFIEMRDKVGDEIFQKKRKLEVDLEIKHQNYYSKYALVTFRPDISYHEAMVRGRRQDEILMNLCALKNEVDLDTTYKLMCEEGLIN